MTLNSLRRIRIAWSVCRNFTTSQSEIAGINKSVSFSPASSFYKRVLPSELVDFSSPEGKQLFGEALKDGNMEGSFLLTQGYFPLAAQFLTQQEPAYCGLSSLTMVLNAANIDPGRKWKGEIF
jgi:glutathione gamma-glutamylcysteinyltransferase